MGLVGRLRVICWGAELLLWSLCLGIWRLVVVRSLLGWLVVIEVGEGRSAGMSRRGLNMLEWEVL